MWAPLAKALDFAEFNGYEAVAPIALELDIASFTIHGLEDIFGEGFTNRLKEILLNELKRMLLNIADTIKGWGWLGQGISTAIYKGIKNFEKSTETNITNSINSSITGAQENINVTAENFGMQTMLKYKQGLGNKKEELNETIKNIQNDSLIKAREIVNETAKNSGTEMLKEISNGANNQSNELNTTVKNIQENSLLNNRENINEIAKIAGTQTMTSLGQGILNEKQNLNNTVGTINNTITNKLNDINTTEAGKQVVNGVAKGINENKNNWTLWNALSGLKEIIVNGVKNMLGIHSPSKVMADIAKFIPLGMAEGIDNEAHSVYESIEKINRGIQVSTKDASINVTSYVDYGAISGSISAQSNVSVNSSITKGIAEAVANAMKQTKLNVNIEAKTEEGVIVKKASQGFKDYVMQTGELPFPVPVG